MALEMKEECEKCGRSLAEADEASFAFTNALSAAIALDRRFRFVRIAAVNWSRVRALEKCRERLKLRCSFVVCA
jgi:hypothetical protein